MTRPRTREVLWLSIWGAIAVLLAIRLWLWGQDRRDARLAQAKAVPVPVRVIRAMPVKGFCRTWLLVNTTLPLPNLTLDTAGMKLEVRP